MKSLSFVFALISFFTSFSLYSSDALTADQIKRQTQLAKQYQYDLELEQSKQRNIEAQADLQRTNQALIDAKKRLEFSKKDAAAAKQEAIDAKQKADKIKNKKTNLNDLLSDTASDVSIKTKTVVTKTTVCGVSGVCRSQKIPDIEVLEPAK